MYPMTNFNPLIINKCKDYLDKTDPDVVYEKYYKGKDDKNNKVLVREDAEKYTTDWVNLMYDFIGNICVVVDSEPMLGEMFLLVDIRLDDSIDNNYDFSFNYESLIPLQMIEDMKVPTIPRYNPRTFITETNDVNLITESTYYNTNEDIENETNAIPKPIYLIGDDVTIREDAMEYIKNRQWCDENNVGFDDESDPFFKYHINKGDKIKIVKKFKGTIEDNRFPWWSMFVNDVDPPGDYNDEIFIPDILLTGKRTPNYQPKKFIYENIDPLNKEAINEFKKDYYLKKTSTVEEIEKYYNISFEQYFNDLYLNDKIDESRTSQLEMRLRNIKNLNIDGLILKKEFFDRTKRDLLKQKLWDIGFDRTSALRDWDESNTDKCIVILFNTADGIGDRSRLDGMNCYTSNLDYMLRSYNEAYSDSVMSNPMNLDEIIKFIDTKIIINPKSMYTPRKFIYENNIWYPFRFKTLEELEEEYGYEWEDHFNSGWNPDMNILLGTVYPYPESELNFDSSQPRTDRFTAPDSQDWSIDWNMLTKNKKTIPSYQPKKFIYENDTWYPYRFKTEKEFIKEFGDEWIKTTNVNGNANWAGGLMDHLFGTPYPYRKDEIKSEEESIDPRNDRFHDPNSVHAWRISWYMLAPNKPEKPTYEPKKFIYENDTWYPYRFKTEEEFIEQYGDEWRWNIEKLPDGYDISWVSDMDYLLGTDFHGHEFQESEQHQLIPKRGNSMYTWYITRPMITGNKPNTPNYKPKKFIYENNIKKLKDF